MLKGKKKTYGNLHCQKIMDENETVIFNSDPIHFKKEKSGLKRNTVRLIDNKDKRFSATPTHICITCRDTKSRFVRKIRDITDFGGYRIYSW